jgi:hypothetical protein
MLIGIEDVAGALGMFAQREQIKRKDFVDRCHLAEYFTWQSQARYDSGKPRRIHTRPV